MEDPAAEIQGQESIELPNTSVIEDAVQVEKKLIQLCNEKKWDELYKKLFPKIQSRKPLVSKNIMSEIINKVVEAGDEQSLLLISFWISHEIEYFEQSNVLFKVMLFHPSVKNNATFRNMCTTSYGTNILACTTIDTLVTAAARIKFWDYAVFLWNGISPLQTPSEEAMDVVLQIAAEQKNWGIVRQLFMLEVELSELSPSSEALCEVLYFCNLSDNQRINLVNKINNEELRVSDLDLMFERIEMDETTVLYKLRSRPAERKVEAKNLADSPDKTPVNKSNSTNYYILMRAFEITALLGGSALLISAIVLSLGAAAIIAGSTLIAAVAVFEGYRFFKHCMNTADVHGVEPEMFRECEV